jgi:hypothetical protein
MNGYWLVCLNPHAPPRRDSRGRCERHCPDRRAEAPRNAWRGGKEEISECRWLTVVVGAGAVGLAVPGGPGLLPGAPVHGGVAGVVVLGAGGVEVAAGVELGLAAVPAGEEGQEHQRRRGGDGEGGGGAHGFLFWLVRQWAAVSEECAQVVGGGGRGAVWAYL